MLREQSVFGILFINIIIIAIWHFAVFMFCILIDPRFFNADKKMYSPRKWERSGRFYSRILKIKLWKDMVPQYRGKNGFSKDHLDGISVEYLDEFIMETCRGEWNHTVNCALCLILMLLDPPPVSLIFAFLVFIGNLPFKLIQRYNRFRLQKLRRTIVRKTQSNRK